MSKKELDLQKLNLAKKPISTQDSLEKAVKSIHDSAKPKERTKRVTIDLPISLYKKIRSKTIEDEITLKDYFLRLSSKDLDNGSDSLSGK